MEILTIVIVGVVCFILGNIVAIRFISFGISNNPEKFINGIKKSMPKSHDDTIAEFSKGINDMAKKEIDRRKADGTWSLGE